MMRDGLHMEMQLVRPLGLACHIPGRMEKHPLSSVTRVGCAVQTPLDKMCALVPQKIADPLVHPFIWQKSFCHVLRDGL